jgi:hypothetical protein
MARHLTLKRKGKNKEGIGEERTGEESRVVPLWRRRRAKTAAVALLSCSCCY